MEKKKLFKIIVAAVIVVVAVVCLCGFIGGKDLMYHLRNRGKLGPLSRSDIEYTDVDAPEPSSADGTINAADWTAAYPYIVATMGDNDKNSYVIDYLEQDPYLEIGRAHV